MSARIDSRIWLVVPAAALLFVVFVYPVFWLLLRSFSDPVWGLQNFRILIDQPVYLRALSNTVMVSGTVTALCLLLGYPLLTPLPMAAAPACCWFSRY
jgi:putative spermidine/putrescine transport system permease protein